MSARRKVTERRARRRAARTARRLASLVTVTAVIVLATGVAFYYAWGSSARTSARPMADSTLAVPLKSAKHTGKAGGVTATAVDPSLFSTGSCTMFTPGDESKSETVFIDAGHGGIDPGGLGVTESGAKVSESQVNLPIEMDAMRVLTGEGYRVVVSRTTQTTVLRLGPGTTSGGLLTVAGAQAEIAARDVCANMGHANLLVGIYMNAGYFGNAGSVTAYDSARPFAAGNERFAALLQSDVLAKLNGAGYEIPDGGVQNDTQLGSTLSAAGQAYGHLMLLGPADPGYFATPSQMPGALIEPVFITDPFEASVAVSARGQQLIADGIAAAAGQYFAAPPATPSAVPSASVKSAAEPAGQYHIAWDYVAD